MSKYEPLTAFLEGKRSEEVPMSFAEFEAVVGTPLPASKQRREWWSNNASNNVLTKAWLAAGYKTERVDIGGQRLVFRRASDTKLNGPERDPAKAEGGSLVARVQARLAGTVSYASDEDLMRPLEEAWEADS